MVDEEIVVDKLRHVNEYTVDLRQMRGASKEAYLADKVTQRAVERTFDLLIRTCIDLARHVRSAEGLPASDSASREMRALDEADVIARDTCEKLEEAVGFLNVLAHRYGDVDHEIVFEILHDDLKWFERFQQEVARWLQSRRS